MSVCTFYEVIPDDLLNQILANDGLIEVLEQIWCIVGIYDVFDELDAEEVDEITEDLPKSSVTQLKSMLSSAKSFPHASIESSYLLHEVGSTKTLLSLGVKDAETVFNHIFSGEKKLYSKNHDFQVVTSARCIALWEILSKVNPSTAIQHYDFSSHDTPELWAESIESELTGLIDCYQHAANHRASVVIGWG